ncbi:MAG: hypothetical protein JNK05_20110 [Myxococcales bacterium]|nr:hypothetical protein [Myxococcales bacterium]
MRDPPPTNTDAGPIAPARRLVFDDRSTISLEPSMRTTVSVRVTDAEGRPAAAEVRWSLLGDSSDATLLATRSNTQFAIDGSSIATVVLQASTSSAVFDIRATTADGAEAIRSVSVSDRGFGSIRVDVNYDGVRGPNQFEVALYADGRCDSLRAARPVRTLTLAPTRGATGLFDSLAADLTFAVVAEGVGTSGERVARGCVEGVRVVRDSEQSITIRTNDLNLYAAGRYDVRVQLGLDVVARSARALWIENSGASDDGRAILRSIGDAVERNSGADARITFDRIVEASLASEVSADLRRRNALPSTRLALWADSIAASLGGALWTLEAEAIAAEGRTRLSFRSARASIDPRTPDDASDDIVREMPVTGEGTVTGLAGDRALVSLDGVGLVVSDLAIAARDAHLARSGSATTAERLRAEVVCSELVPLVQRHATGCDSACIVTACNSTLDRFGTQFDFALRDATATLRHARASFVGVARSRSGSVTIQSVAASAVEGSFVEDPSRPVRGVGTLLRQ